MNNTQLKKTLAQNGASLFADINAALVKHGLPPTAQSISFVPPHTVKVPASSLSASDSGLNCADDEEIGTCTKFDGVNTIYYPCCVKKTS
jgi:hypothetical protein